jgi:hypothetical protein
MCFDNDASGANALEEAAAARKVPFKSVVIDNDDARQLYERRFVLVRPDGQVAWRGDALPDDPLVLIDTVRGAQCSRLETKSVEQSEA